VSAPADAESVPSEVLTLERDGAVAIVRMNRPDQHNAADAALHRRLAEVWTEIRLDPTVRAVVLTGAGGAFSAGGDFALMQATRDDPDVADVVFDEARRTVMDMINLPQPIVAAVNGPAVGLGASLAALCDISVVADTAFLADPHLGVGLVPGDGAAMLWPLLIGLTRAKEFILLGERLTAAQALEIGLVNRVVPQEKALEAALEIAHKLAKVPHRALQDTKRLMNLHANRALLGALDQAIAAERQSVASPEHGERVARMIERSRAGR
jgi:enoyl-CoA hydratase